MTSPLSGTDSPMESEDNQIETISARSNGAKRSQIELEKSFEEDNKKK